MSYLLLGFFNLKNMAQRKQRKKERGKDKRVRKNAVLNQIDWDFWREQYLLLEENLMEYAKEEKLKEMTKNEIHPDGASFYKYHPYKMMMGGLSYIKRCVDNEQPLSLNGLVLGTKCSLRQFASLISQTAKDRVKTDVFKYPLETLRTFVAMFYEFAGNDKLNPTFPIFLLKNMGMEDKQVIEENKEDEGFTPEERQKLRDSLNDMVRREK